MEITLRSFWTLVHGMGFGATYLLACSGALVELYRICVPYKHMQVSEGPQRFLCGYLLAMVFVAWIAVLTGAFVVYPWYRASVPAGTPDLSQYPQRFLLHNPSTAGWHRLGMEWKEHVAWFAPISITMVAFVSIRYGRDLARHKLLRIAVLGFTAASFVAAGIAGGFGALINKYAPVQGGRVITLSRGVEK